MAHRDHQISEKESPDSLSEAIQQKLIIWKFNEPIAIDPLLLNKGVADCKYSKATIQAWNPRSPVSTTELENGFILCKFSNEKEMLRVWTHQLWSFIGHPLLMVQWRPGILVSMPALSSLPIWSQIHGLPPEYINPSLGKVVAGYLGTLEELDISSKEVQKGRFLQMRIRSKHEGYPGSGTGHASVGAGGSFGSGADPYEQMWEDHLGCSRVIKEAWFKPSVGSPEDHLNQKITYCRDDLRSWNRKTFGNLHVRIRRLQSAIAALQAYVQSQAIEL
ncbi:hypothetical protein HHK36_009075 [Tetracentron sinense]|uniref:DUF4283 domain-containing protein n=1 Tax=Tetracentron sinense TaxID=13715 RepID=A0A835DKP9_TETSI|nr:hypothetical protein HHK36_009075 [Tetracentron sinense]